MRLDWEIEISFTDKQLLNPHFITPQLLAWEPKEGKRSSALHPRLGWPRPSKKPQPIDAATGMIWDQPHPCSFLFLIALPHPHPPRPLPLISVPLSLAWFEVSCCGAPGWVSSSQRLSLSLSQPGSGLLIAGLWQQGPSGPSGR